MFLALMFLFQDNYRLYSTCVSLPTEPEFPLSRVALYRVLGEGWQSFPQQ
jgi:hypothetical protein